MSGHVPLTHWEGKEIRGLKRCVNCLQPDSGEYPPAVDAEAYDIGYGIGFQRGQQAMAEKAAQHRFEQYSLRCGCSCGWGTVLCVKEEGYKLFADHIRSLASAEPPRDSFKRSEAKGLGQNWTTLPETEDEPTVQTQTSGPRCKRCNAFTTHARVNSHGLCMRCQREIDSL